MANKKISARNKLIDEHNTVALEIALQAVRINEMQKILSKQSDRLLQIEVELEALDAKASGSGLN